MKFVGNYLGNISIFINTNLKQPFLLFLRLKIQIHFTMVSKTVSFCMVVLAVLVVTTAAKPFSEGNTSIL